MRYGSSTVDVAAVTCAGGQGHSVYCVVLSFQMLTSMTSRTKIESEQEARDNGQHSGCAV